MVCLRTHRLTGILCLMALVLLAVACGQPTPPGPTLTPLPPLPPQVINRTPARGQELGITAPIAIAFDQAMDHASVEEAFRISPQVAGSLSWQDETLLFEVERAFERDTTYRITVGTEARSAAGLALSEAFTLDFRTMGFLEVTSVQPAPGTADVQSDALVTVMFNRPVVPLSDVTSQSGLAGRQILEFRPPVAGEGQWLNTSIYTFKPSPAFLPGTTYRVTVEPERLIDLTDSVLAEPYIWEFGTAPPRVVEALTSDPVGYVGPSPLISITFNMTMDHVSVEERFSLLPEQGLNALPGQFQWDGTTMGFKPAVPLSLDTQYQVTLAAGAQSSLGGEGTAEDFQWSFRTISSPRLLSTSPPDGDQDVDPYTSVLVTFNGPMNPNTLLDSLTIIPEPTDVYTTWVESDTKVYISFGSKPSTTYTVIFGPDLEGRYGHRLDRPHQLKFTTRPLPPSIGMPPSRIGTYNAYTTTAVYVQHVNVSELELELYRMDREDFLQLSGQGWWQLWDSYEPAVDLRIRRWKVKVDYELNRYLATAVPLADDGTSALAPGLYYLEVRAPNVEGFLRHVMLVSRANVTLKVTSAEALVWLTDLSSGQPIPNRDVVILSPDGETVASGRTQSDGIFFAALQWPEEPDPWATMVALVGPEQDPAVCLANWDDGISVWQFGLPSEPYLEPYHAYFYTERDIYRPGQKVYFKGILRSDDDGRYSLPSSAKSMLVTVTDDEGKELYRKDLPLSEMGTLHGEIELAEEASLGTYSISGQLGERFFGTSFRVAEYRKPEFAVSVSTAEDEFIQGDPIVAEVSASYYFGGAVANAKLEWRLMSQDYFFEWTGRELLPSPFRQAYYDFHDWDYDARERQTVYGELVTEGRGLLDEDGTYTIEVPADVSEYQNSQIFTIEASVTDPSNQQVSGRHSVIAHKGEFYVGLAPQEYIGTAGREAKVNVITVDRDSKPVPGVPLTVVFLESRWYNVQEQADDGRFYWSWKLEETPVYTTAVTTDGTGTAITSFVPGKGGSYRVRAIGRDERGNEIRSSTYLWISSGDFVSWRQENHDRIELVTDKKVYAPGETARVLVPSPFQGPVKALLTVERGHIYERRVVTLQTNSDQLEIPIVSDYAPNAYVSLVIVKGLDKDTTVPSYRVGYAAIEISTEQKELNIQLTPDRTTPYGPGDQARLAVVATDHQGQGVQAEFSLQLVDLSVLALTNGGHGTLLDSFYRQRGLGVRTGATLAISVDRYRQQAQPPAAKGGDGGPSGFDVVRSRFLDTAYWNAQIRTDAQGRAEVTVSLPDNLTTWRATAMAITADTLVGNANVDIMTTKNLLLQPVAPRFAVLGDEVQLGAVVHNNTDQTLAVSVSLEGEGLTIDKAMQHIEVTGRGRQTVQWQAKVVSTPSLLVTWRAAGGEFSDGVQLTLPVYHYSTPEVVATAGQVPSGESRVETVRLPSRLDPTQGELTVQLDPSLAASMRDALTYLEQYPYACTEQTVSRFLPNVVTYRALQQLGIRNPELEARLPQYVGVGLQRLYALQHYDGGWGWWLADESQPFVSAYVLFGMSEARKAGFAVDDQVMARAARYLEGVLDATAQEPAIQGNARAFILLVLADYGEGDLGRTVALYEQRDTLDLYGKAYLLMALHILQPEQTGYRKTLLSELTSAAILSATGAHWEEEDIDYRTMSTNTRSTALVLQALVRTDPSNPLLPNVVRWLMTARKAGHWETTQETAWSVMALTEFMLSTGELQANYDYRVTLNGQALGQGTVTTQNVQESQKLLVAIQDLLAEESNRIILERLGLQVEGAGEGTPSVEPSSGQLYYSLYLRYFLPVEDVVALDRGIIVSRQYTLVEGPTQPIQSAQVGDVIQVKLTIIAPNDLHYLVVEDPLPAGCEALDVSLKTTSGAYQSPELSRQDRRQLYWWYFTESELRDEKVALFATYLGKGTYEYTYLIRASVPGRFLTMPTQAYEMYFPEVFGRSDGLVFTITE